MAVVRKMVLFFTLTLGNASKCPEVRKPHVTSCTIFYNCINLPEGGYVWAPSRCADGLVFQPYLRLCVLPGDTWTCNDITTASSTGFVDKTENSYSQLIGDSSDALDAFSNLGNTPIIIPYPLIEVEELSGEDENEEKSSEDPVKLLKTFNSQQNTPVAMLDVRDKDNSDINSKPFLSKIFLYQHFGPVKQQTFLSLPFVDFSGLIQNKHVNNDILEHLVENYIFNRKSDMIKTQKKSGMTTTEIEETSAVQPNFVMTSEEHINEQEIDESNNVLKIKGNLGHKEYMTVEKYKSLASVVKIQVLEIVSCMRGIRLPNLTDCTKYYTCEPSSAEVHEFVCPSNTAFNNQISLCDTQKYKLCKKNRNVPIKMSEAIKSQRTKLKINKDEKRESFHEKPCQTTGKFADMTSEIFYYLCYTSDASGGVESIRMACPNDLVFCPGRKVCTAKRLCSNFD